MINMTMSRRIINFKGLFAHETNFNIKMNIPNNIIIETIFVWFSVMLIPKLETHFIILSNNDEVKSPVLSNADVR